MKKYNKGFTLIELLVVIAIIGILSSIVVVNLTGAKNKANRASVLASVTSMGTEFILCADDNLYINPPDNVTSGGGEICTDAAGAPQTGHSATWPTLGTTGYSYPVIANTSALVAGDQTITLAATGNTSIACIWSGTKNLTCN